MTETKSRRKERKKEKRVSRKATNTVKERLGKTKMERGGT